jgi:hypothetical protein
MQCMDLKITSNLRMKLTDSFLKKNIFFWSPPFGLLSSWPRLPRPLPSH